MKAFRLALVAAVAGTLVTVASCVKKDFDAAPDMTGYDPGLKTSMTIAELKSKFTGPSAKLIDSNWIVAGVVTSNDKAGNFYQQLNIEDSTGGIMLLVEPSDLYGRYPVGRKVYVKLKGLYYGYYGKYDQVGYGSAVANIPTNMVDNFIVPANVGNKVPLQVFNGLSALKSTNVSMLSRLVRIDNVQVVATDTAKTYAEPKVTTNIMLEDCDGNKIVLRNSGYADFRGYKLPKGKGSITAIYTTFNSTPQLYIRDTSDLKFYDARCGSSSSGGNTLFSENFNSATSGDINLTGWTNVGTVGGQKFKFSNAGSTSNPYARVSAFGTNQVSVVSWLVTPAINLASVSNAILTFKSANGFDNGASLKVYATANFTGDVNTTTWTQLNPTLAPSSTSGFSSFVSSGNVSLSAFAGGNVFIAFKYEGADDPANPGADKTTTWEIDDMKVTD